MATSVTTRGVAASTQSLKEILTNPWSYFPNLVGGDLVGVGQIGPNRFLAAFGRNWRSGTPNQTDPPLFTSPTLAGPRVFDIDTASRGVTEITPSLLLSPNASLRAAVMASSGMHLIASTDSGTHAQFVQNFASHVRNLEPKPLAASVWSNGIKHAVEWDRGAAPDRGGFFALGADADNYLYASRVRAELTAAQGYNPARRSYLSATGWTSRSAAQTPLLRKGGTILASPVPVGIVHRRQWWYLMLPKQMGAVWGWEVLRASSFLSSFAHVFDVPGDNAGPTPARFLPGIALENDPELPPGVAWTSSSEKVDSFVPRLEQLQF